jgi:hypothetical protein
MIKMAILTEIKLIRKKIHMYAALYFNKNAILFAENW